MDAFKRGDRVMYGGREWRVVARDTEIDQVRIVRTIWDTASGTTRKLTAWSSPHYLTRVDRAGQ